jgi:hypothetical protein
MAFMYFDSRDGVRLAYQETGDGRPLILVHGHQDRGSHGVDSGLAGRLAGRSLGGRTVVRMLARGATPRQAVISGYGLKALLHAAENTGW